MANRLVIATLMLTQLLSWSLSPLVVCFKSNGEFCCLNHSADTACHCEETNCPSESPADTCAVHSHCAVCTINRDVWHEDLSILSTITGNLSPKIEQFPAESNCIHVQIVQEQAPAVAGGNESTTLCKFWWCHELLEQACLSHSLQSSIVDKRLACHFMQPPSHSTYELLMGVVMRC
jgi:hypothetical protein